MRSARSASRLVREELCWWPRSKGPWGKWPRWPSLMAVVERAEREVVVLVGVPLLQGQRTARTGEREHTYGISEGVSGFEGGRLVRVRCGVVCAMMIYIDYRLGPEHDLCSLMTGLVQSLLPLESKYTDRPAGDVLLYLSYQDPGSSPRSIVRCFAYRGVGKTVQVAGSG